MSLADFLGSMITLTRSAPEGFAYFRISARRVDFPARLKAYVLKRTIPSVRGGSTSPSPQIFSTKSCFAVWKKMYLLRSVKSVVSLWRSFSVEKLSLYCHCFFTALSLVCHRIVISRSMQSCMCVIMMTLDSHPISVNVLSLGCLLPYYIMGGKGRTLCCLKSA